VDGFLRTLHDTSPKGFQVSLAMAADLVVFIPSGFEQSCQSAKGRISGAKQRTPYSREGQTIEDKQCQKIGGGYKAVKFRFLLFL